MKILLSLILIQFSFAQDITNIATTIKPPAKAGPLLKSIRDSYIPDVIDSIFYSYCLNKYFGQTPCKQQVKDIKAAFSLNENIGVVFIDELLNLLPQTITTELLNSIDTTSSIFESIMAYTQNNYEKSIKLTGVLFQDTMVSKEEVTEVIMSTKTNSLTHLKTGEIFYNSGFINNLNFIYRNIETHLSHAQSLTFKKNIDLLKNILLKIKDKEIIYDLPKDMSKSLKSKAVYHFYVNAYFTQRLIKANPSEESYFSNIPLLLNANYEILQDNNLIFRRYFYTSKDKIHFSFFPEDINTLNNLKNVSEDTYMGVLAKDYAMKNSSISYEQFLKDFQNPREYILNL